MGIYVYKLCSKSEALRNRINEFDVSKDTTIGYFKFAGKLDNSIFGGYENNEKTYNRIIRFYKQSWKDDVPDYIVYHDSLYKVNKDEWHRYLDMGLKCMMYHDEYMNQFFRSDGLFKKIGDVDSDNNFTV